MRHFCLDISVMFCYNYNMRRKLLSKLQLWKDNPSRKPLILQGARQTGKTWLLKTFGEACYTNTAVFNFEETPSLASLFSGSLKPGLLLDGLSALYGRRLNPADTLIIFDEVQEAPRGVHPETDGDEFDREIGKSSTHHSLMSKTPRATFRSLALFFVVS